MSTVSTDDIMQLLNTYFTQQNEWNKEALRRNEEAWKRGEEADRRFSEYKTKSEKEWEKLRQELGGIGRSHGEQVEAMFVNLGSKFNALGFDFPKEANGEIRFLGENKKVIAAVDRLLENGTSVMAVEVKAKLKQDDVDEHIRRLGIISEHNKKHNDNRKLLGAVAGGVVPRNVLEYAQKRGLYVLVQNGDSIEIAEIPANFVPQEW